MVDLSNNIDSNFSLFFEKDNAERKYNLKYAEDSAWLVFRHSFTNLKNVITSFKQSFKIKEGDVIKFGKIHMTVKELFIRNTNTLKKARSFLENKNEPINPRKMQVDGDISIISINNQNRYFIS